MEETTQGQQQAQESAPTPEVSSPTESTATAAPEGASASQETVAQAADPMALPGKDGAPQVAVPPAYQPNWKFKVHDAEHEIPEFLRSVVKDADTEKKVREIFEKAYGLDFVKPKFEKTRTDLEQAHATIQKEYLPLRQNVQQAMHFAKQKDYDNFLDQVGIPQEDIFNWVHQKLQEMEQPQHIQQALQQQRKINRDNWQLKQHNQELSQWKNTSQEQAALQTVDMTLAKPQYQTVMQAFDARVGRIGAFRQELLERAGWKEVRNERLGIQQPISLEEVASEMLALYGLAAQPSQAQPNPPSAPPQPGMPQTGAKATPPPVIPNVSGQNVSPTKKLPRSVADLRKQAAAYTS